MDEGVKEECAVTGVILKPGNRNYLLPPELVYEGMFGQQRRGQLSAGACSFNSEIQERMRLSTEVGLVNDLFKVRNRPEAEKVIKYHAGQAIIGHGRYSTKGTDDEGDQIAALNEAQPFLRPHGRPGKMFALCWNGNLANYPELRKMYNQYILKTDTDTEIMMHVISRGLKQAFEDRGEDSRIDLFDLSRRLMPEFDGAFNVLTLFANGKMMAWRDPRGFKPLVIGETPDFYAIASESIALDRMGIKKNFPLDPGKSAVFDYEKGLDIKEVAKSPSRSRCYFEWVYFSDASSYFDNRSVYSVRRELGKELAKIETHSDYFKSLGDKCIVVPVPHTAIPAAESYARALGLEANYAIAKIEGSRGFINRPSERERIMSREYVFYKEALKGKVVVLIEDSIVRSQTLRKIVSSLHNNGVSEIHARVTAPPITDPCFYGIAMSTYNELIAQKYSDKSRREFEEAVARDIGLKSLRYQTLDGMVRAISFPKSELCLACLGEGYPTEAGERRAKEERLVRVP